MQFSRKLLFLTPFALAVTAYTSSAVADTLVDATFTDGTSITGSFSLNVYGYLDTADITTTAYSSFSGYDYTSGSIIQNSPSAYADGINLTNANYSLSLYLVFEQPLNQPGNDLINTSASYECIGFSCGSNSADIRYFASGYTTTPIPEPETFVLFATGLFGIAGRLRALKAKAPTYCG